MPQKPNTLEYATILIVFLVPIIAILLNQYQSLEVIFNTEGNIAPISGFVILTNSSTNEIPNATGWYEISNTKIRSVCPASTPNYSFYSFCNAVVNAWSSGAVDTLRNRLIVWGGGHNDYYGNEIYAIDLNLFEVKRLTDPSPINPYFSPSCPDTLSDGNPNSRHTYDGVAYIEHLDKLFAFSGSLACAGGNTGGDTWTFDFKTLRWQNMSPSGTIPRSNFGIATAYDPNTKKVYLHDHYALYSYSFETNTYQRLTPDTGDNHLNNWMTATIDPVRKKFIVVGGGWDSIGGVVVYDINPSGSYTKERWTTTGGNAVVNGASPGLAYDPVSDRIIAWSGGDTVYSLNMDTKAWTPITFANGPGPATDTGTFGRFDYVPKLGVFVNVNSVDSNAFAIRLSPTAPIAITPDTIAPAASITSPSNGATVSSTITVTASASDNIGVAGVQFKLDGTNLDVEDATSPYSISWDTKTASNGAHTLTATARDAAGNNGTSTIAVTVSNVATPPTGQIDIPTGVFVAIQQPYRGQGIGNNKHVTYAHNPIDGRLYSVGGDWSDSDFPDTQSYSQSMFSLSIMDKWINKTNPAAGWRREQRYCRTDGTIQPKHPDFVGWTWDSKRNVFWMVPGTMETSHVNCAGETTSRSSDPLFLAYNLMTFDPVTKKWTAETADPGPNIAETWKSHYDNESDSLIRLGWDGGSGAVVNIYDIQKKTWSKIGLATNALGRDMRIEIEGSDADYEKRFIYAVDGFAGRLHRFNMNTKTIEDLGPVPGGTIAWGTTYDTYVAWDSIHKVLFFWRPDTSTLHVYNPANSSWESPPVVTSPPGLTPTVRHAFVFDPYQNVLALLGSTSPSESSIYFYRYSNGTVTAPVPDTTSPAVAISSPLAGSTLTGIAAISATASDNIGVLGVQFKLDGNNLGAEDFSSPYSISFNTITAVNGLHTLTAVARDLAGNTKTSAPVSITVSDINLTTNVGDINSDKVVDILDVVLIANYFGKTVFDSRADAAPPFGTIDIFDVMVVVLNWGRTY